MLRYAFTVQLAGPEVTELAKLDTLSVLRSAKGTRGTWGACCFRRTSGKPSPGGEPARRTEPQSPHGRDAGTASWTRRWWRCGMSSPHTPYLVLKFLRYYYCLFLYVFFPQIHDATRQTSRTVQQLAQTSRSGKQRHAWMHHLKNSSSVHILHYAPFIVCGKCLWKFTPQRSDVHESDWS